MQKRKPNLQRHRMRAFAATLVQLENRLQSRLNFILEYQDVYHFPKRMARRNTRALIKWIKAIEKLKGIQPGDY